MRPTVYQWAMKIAAVTAERSTCLRRHVGCVLMDNRNHIVATGYNGVASGMPHCSDVNSFGQSPNACSGSSLPSGVGLDKCMAIHAEQNALLQCSDVYQISAAVVTVSPCISCVKLLLNTGCQKILYAEEYPHFEARELWVKSGRVWINLSVL